MVAIAILNTVALIPGNVGGILNTEWTGGISQARILEARIFVHAYGCRREACAGITLANLVVVAREGITGIGTGSIRGLTKGKVTNTSVSRGARGVYAYFVEAWTRDRVESTSISNTVDFFQHLNFPITGAVVDVANTPSQQRVGCVGRWHETGKNLSTHSLLLSTWEGVGGKYAISIVAARNVLTESACLIQEETICALAGVGCVIVNTDRVRVQRCADGRILLALVQLALQIAVTKGCLSNGSEKLP